MKVKPIKIKIKEPTPSAADRLYAKHQAIRKEKGLPDPSEYKKKLDNMRENKTTEVPTSLKSGHDEKKAKEVASKSKGNLVKGRQQSAGKDKAGKKLWWEEVEQLDELSSETKQSYKSKALLQIKELKPWTKKGEYKDLAKNLIAKRQKGIAKVSEEAELDEQLYKKERFVSGPPKKDFKAHTLVSPKNEDANMMTVQNKSGGRMTVFKKFKDIITCLR